MSTYTPIATQTLGSAASEVIFSSIPQNYTDLILVMTPKAVSTTNVLTCQVGNNSIDTGSNYSNTYLAGSGTAQSGRYSNQTFWYASFELLTTGSSQNSIMQFLNYSNSSTYKTSLTRYNEATAGVGAFVNLWRSTSPINIIKLAIAGGTSFAAGSTFTIYGVAAGNSSAKASGGNIVTTDGSYWYHTFTSSGIFVPNSALTCDYLVVAGGGGGSGSNGGAGSGGGAGGYRTSIGGSALSLTANTVYQALVGAGGASGPVSLPGNAGINSVFSSITSIGGGYGAGSGNGVVGGDGGSGGGGNGYTGGAGNGTVGQGNNGGAGNGTGPGYGRGGGGGAGAGGGSGTTTTGGNGGNGLSNSISGTSITYAGGGGGGVESTGAAGTGGTGGGGAGRNASGGNGGAGTPNTGGGGGGAGSGSIGGAGGSGIIILRYAV
jgi:hypothetical protein